MYVTQKTQGFTELKALLRQLPADVESKVLGTGVMAGARTLAKAAKAAAPKFTGKLSGGQKGTAALHAKYGNLKSNIKAKLLPRRYKNKRAAIVTRGDAFWGDFINRGTRYIAATHWYDRVFDATMEDALKTMKAYMVAKITQVSLQAIARTGANKR